MSDDPLTAEELTTLLDPAYRRAVACLPPDDADWATERPERLRALYAAARAHLATGCAPDVAVTPWRSASASGLRFMPEDGETSGATVIWFHGGGWIVGAPETHALPASHFARLSRLPVLAARYRLAPEHPFPAQVEDAVAAIVAVAAEGRGPIVLAGDSAGAALAFWATARLPQEEAGRIAGLVAFYGAYGAGETESMHRLGPVSPGVSAREMAAFRAHLGLPPREAAIVDAVTAAGPPVWLSAADLDPLRDDSRLLAERLRAAGRPVTLDEVPALPHGFVHFAACVPAAMSALERAAQWVRRITEPARHAP